MKYKGQHGERLEPLNDFEREHPELLFTEKDRRLFHKAIRSVPLIGNPDVTREDIYMPDIETFGRWKRMAEHEYNHQARFLYTEFLQAYRDLGAGALADASIIFDPEPSIDA